MEDRRTGKNIFYRLSARHDRQALLGLLRQSEDEIPEIAEDREALQLVLEIARTKCAAIPMRWQDASGARFAGAVAKGLAEILLSLLQPKTQNSIII